MNAVNPTKYKIAIWYAVDGDVRFLSHRDTVRLYVGEAARAVPAVVDRLQKANLNPMSVTITQPTLDDVFLQVTGQRLEATETVEV